MSAGSKIDNAVILLEWWLDLDYIPAFIISIVSALEVIPILVVPIELHFIFGEDNGQSHPPCGYQFDCGREIEDIEDLCLRGFLRFDLTCHQEGPCLVEQHSRILTGGHLRYDWGKTPSLDFLEVRRIIKPIGQPQVLGPAAVYQPILEA